jgi:hypothetical protein
LKKFVLKPYGVNQADTSMKRTIKPKWTMPNLLGFLLLAAPAVVQGQFSYSINADNTITITSYTGAGGAVTIPDTITGLPVISIGEEAFAYCTSLSSVAIGSSVTNIGEEAFVGCSSLGTFTVDVLNSFYSSANGVLFDKSETMLVEFPGGVGGSYTIPRSVTTIGDYAFDGCCLNTIIIPGSVTSIPDYAFAYDYKLTNVTIPGSVTSIGEVAFEYCTNLTSLAIPDSVTNIAEGAFAETSVTSVTIPGGVTSIGEYLFDGCTRLTNVMIERGTSIGQSAFQDCSSLTSVTIPGGVTNLNDGAFEGCTNLSSVYFIGNAPSVGLDVFYGDNNATVYYVPGTIGWSSRFGGLPAALGVPSIVDGYYTCTINANDTIVITNYSGLGGDVTIPSTVAGLAVTSIGDEAFFGCTSLTNVTIPGGVTSIGDYAFVGCTKLSSVYFTGNAPSVGLDVFYGDNSATVYCLPGTSGWSSPFGGLPAEISPILTGYYTCTINANDTLAIIHYSGLGGEVTIPSTIAGLAVTSIGDEAFFSCTSLTNVTIPGGVTSIGDGAFYDCTSLTNVTIPDSVTSIGDDAFYDCTSLTNVTIPGGVTNIGDQAFEGCTKLSSVYFTGNAPSVGLDVFYGDNSATVYYLPGTSGWSSPFGGLPAEISPILTGYYTCTINANDTLAIIHYSGLGGDVTIPSTIAGLAVTRIGDEAFFGCTSLTNVTIPGGVTSIGDYAFFGCTKLTNVTISGGVTNIGYEAFENCTGLTAIAVNTNNSFYSSLNGVLFDKSQSRLIQYPGGLGGSYTIPSSVNCIGNEAFESCTGLTSVTISGGVTNIGYEAFENCTGLTNVTIPDSVTSIGDYAFVGCTSLTNVTIPDSVTSIGDYAFVGCTSLTAVTVDTNNSFYSSLNGVLFDKSQTTLIQYPGGLGGSYTIPSSVTSIGVAFASCTSLTSVTIPDSVTSMGEHAFFGCTSLTSVTICGGVTSIGYYAFGGCTKLSSVYFTGNAPSVGLDVFYGDNSATVYYLPGTSGWGEFVANAGQFAFLPVVLWNPLIQTSGTSFGVRNNQFGFNVTGTTNIPIVVEACTNLAKPVWTPLQSVLLTNGLVYFSEPFQADSSGRFYRISAP